MSKLRKEEVLPDREGCRLVAATNKSCTSGKAFQPDEDDGVRAVAECGHEKSAGDIAAEEIGGKGREESLDDWKSGAAAEGNQ